MDPVSASALISAAGSLVSGVGGLFGAAKNRKVAKENAQLAYKTAIETTDKQNAANLQLMEKNNAFNLEQWEREMEYNTPSNQRKRLEEAGYHPMALLQGANAGNASAAPQASEIRPDFSTYKAGAEKVAYQIPELSNMFQGLADAMYKYQMLKGISLDNEKKAITNQYLDTYLDYRNTGLQRKLMAVMQDYALKGGDVTEEQQQFFRTMQMNKVKLDNQSLDYLYRLRKQQHSQNAYHFKLYKDTEGDLLESMGISGKLLQMGIQFLGNLIPGFKFSRGTKSVHNYVHY